MERVELHCHSIYSEQDGVSRIKDIIEFATANNMPAVAITDHASVAGYREAAYYGSHHEGLKVIYGMEAFVVNDLEPSVSGDKKYIMEAPSFHVTFLIKNKEGKSDAILDGFCNPYVSEAAEELADVEEMFDKLCAK